MNCAAEGRDEMKMMDQAASAAARASMRSAAMPEINGFLVGDTAQTGRAVANIVTFRMPGTTFGLNAREMDDPADLMIEGACDELF